RYYPVAQQSTTEASITQTLTGHVYVVLGDTIREEPGVWRLRIASHPLMDWVFGGAGLVALGGFMSLTARIRRRAPAADKAPADGAEGPTPAAAAGVPA